MTSSELTAPSFGNDWPGASPPKANGEAVVIEVIDAQEPPLPEQYTLPEPGDVIDGNYRVTGELSRGAMGVVLSAFDERLRRNVAIKVIRAELFHAGFVRQFLHEARAMARVSHPHVVAIYALGEFRGAPYFVMERIDGSTLEAWLSQNPVPSRVDSDAPGGAPSLAVDLETRLRLLSELCSGVEAIHAAGAVHRDLKPGNVLLDQHLQCRVADFGLSVFGDDVPPEVAGTIAYLAPELMLLMGERRQIHAISDVYSLGCIAYELLTGQHPSRERGLNSGIRRASEVLPPSALRPDLPPGMDQVILSALNADPEERTPTVTAFACALRELRSVRPDRVLIVEDDPDFSELLRETLAAKFPAAEVHCVDNGVAALAWVDEHPAAVALIDLQMPTMDGIALTRALRERPHASAMPIIVLSGGGGASEWKKLASLGADRFLLKPVNLDDVAAIIERTMRERRAS
ncbi:MAG TPA: protein kinase [Polyangiaceae bacterium]|jgi:serine/threonine-protein kinase|nr:protein kinase [Polyangiaceae bacterium]